MFKCDAPIVQVCNRIKRINTVLHNTLNMRTVYFTPARHIMQLSILYNFPNDPFRFNHTRKEENKSADNHGNTPPDARGIV